MFSKIIIIIEIKSIVILWCKMDEKSSKGFEHLALDSSEDIIMELDNNIEKLFNHLAIE